MIIEVDVDVNSAKTEVNVNSPLESTVETPFVLPPHNLGDHKNVDETDAVTNNYLKFDGTNWVPATPDWLTQSAFNATPAAAITSQQVTNWDIAFEWGNHAIAGYLTQSAFNTSPAGAITSQQVSEWNTAFGWGNHAQAGYLAASQNLNDLSNKPTARTNLGFPTTNSNQVLYGAAGNLYQQNANFVFDGTNLVVGHTTAAATLHARGASATVGDALLVQNGGASPATRFRVGNDGTTNLCNPNVQLTYSSSILSFTLIGGGGVAINPANTLSNALSQALNIQSSGVSAAATVSTRQVLVGISDTRSSGASRYSGVEINGTINQSGTATGIVSALYVNGTVTNANDFRAIEVTNGKVLLGGVNKHSYLVTHRLSDTERNALTNLVAGAIIFNTTAGKHQGFDGTNWNNLW